MSDVDQATRLLEIELERKRSEWKKKSARSRSIRTQSYVALFFLLAGCVIVYFVVTSQLNEVRAARQSSAGATQK